MRTGPIGRLVRAVWTIVVALSLFSLVDQRGPARFRDAHVLTEPSVWFLDALMLIVFAVLIGALAGDRGARRARVAALIALSVLVVVAAAASLVLNGSAWGFPLADGVWIFDIAMLAIELLAFVIVIAIGLPGCELGVWPWLVARVRGDHAFETTGLACVVGLDAIDRWEARRRLGASV